MSTAVVIEAPGEHQLVEHTPREPAAGEALVRVHAVGICGSDREVYQGNRPEGYVRYPLTPGHEWSGTVEAVGSGVPASLVGRKVVGEGFRNCQVCDRCHAGETTLCTAGYEETGFTQPGAMATTLTLPARLLHALPDDADLTAAALLEPAACIAAAALKANARPGERVAVVGTGTLGMFAVQFLKAGSPSELLVVGTRPDRAELSRTFGATDFRTRDQELPDDFDVVIETAGSASAANTAASLLRRGGRLVPHRYPGRGRRRTRPHRSRRTAAGGAHRVRSAAGRLGTHGAGLRGRAPRSAAARHPRVAAGPVPPGHRVGGVRRPEGREGPPPAMTHR
ncbi:threonine dehydrogenase-like Zn-dependent dehydrogenase [Streptomyces sp. SAI-149]|nr:threonine dehydrogenase-like Zn-dependent dehydrogenase [Streptomyces sp. SAI-149]